MVCIRMVRFVKEEFGFQDLQPCTYCLDCSLKFSKQAKVKSVTVQFYKQKWMY